jgi:CubicO group peptidase (beta-lactamase class C family)
LSNQRLESSNNDINETIEELMIEGHMPSLSACVIKHDHVVWAQSYGYANLQTRRKATLNTVYLAGSVSKTITSTALLQLYEHGYFDLDDDVNEYLPFSLRNPQHPDIPITFRMLLAHHSSLSHDFLGLFVLFSLFNLPQEYLAEYLQPGGTLYNPRMWNSEIPGEYPCYSSVGFEILGYLVELLSNQSLEQYCQEHIFQPLEMKNTSFEVQNFSNDQLAKPYIWFLHRYLPLPNYVDKNAASGGLRTTIHDLSHFLIAHMNNGTYKDIRILENDTINLMHTIQYPDSINSSYRQYGLGWFVFEDLEGNYRREGHTGTILGGVTFMFWHPEDQAGIIFFINQYSRLRVFDFLSWLSLADLLFEITEEYP